MNSYEAMILIRPDISEEERKKVFDQISKTLTKKDAKVDSADIWQDKRKLTFRISSTLTSGGIKKYSEALFYLVNFQVDPAAIQDLRNEFKLNDAIIRVMIIKK